MSKALELRKKTGIMLAIIGIVLSLFPALKMAGGGQKTLFQLIRYKELFDFEAVTAEQLTVIGVMIIMIYGLFVHILNLILWTRKTEKTYLGVMGFSWASFLAMIMIACIMTMFDGEIISMLPLTIWQWLRIPVILAEAIVKLNGEELFSYFTRENH